MTNAEQQDYSVTSKTETFRLQPRYFQDQLDDDMERSPEFTLISRWNPEFTILTSPYLFTYIFIYTILHFYI